jgi:hypothetical protein
MAKKKKRAGQFSRRSWSRFMPNRSIKDRATLESLLGSNVSLSVPGPATLQEQVIQIANLATNPLAVGSLCDELNNVKLSRGSTYSDSLGNILDEIAENFPNMRWWITERGLNMAIVPPDEVLDYFDSFAGELCITHWKDGLSEESLKFIAEALDTKAAERKWKFLDSFEPAARKKIAAYNKQNSRRPIETFERAAAHPRFVRLVRQRLYRARARFLKRRHPPCTQ